MQKFFLQHTSQNQKVFIRQAMRLKDGDEAGQKGWKCLGAGASCIAYRKGSVVVKFFTFYNREYLKDTIKFYFRIHPYDRKYFTRIFAYDMDRIVQPYVRQGRIRWTNGMITKARRVVERYKLIDVDLPPFPCRYSAWNVGRYKGRPSIFDLSHETPPKRKKRGRRSKKQARHVYA